MRIYQAGPLFSAAEIRWHKDFKTPERQIGPESVSNFKKKAIHAENMTLGESTYLRKSANNSAFQKKSQIQVLPTNSWLLF